MNFSILEDMLPPTSGNGSGSVSTEASYDSPGRFRTRREVLAGLLATLGTVILYKDASADGPGPGGSGGGRRGFGPESQGRPTSNADPRSGVVRIGNLTAPNFRKSPVIGEDGMMWDTRGDMKVVVESTKNALE